MSHTDIVGRGGHPRSLFITSESGILQLSYTRQYVPPDGSVVGWMLKAIPAGSLPKPSGFLGFSATAGWEYMDDGNSRKIAYEYAVAATIPHWFLTGVFALMAPG